MDATCIARHTEGLKGFDLAAAYLALATEVASTFTTWTTTDELVASTLLHRWLTDAASTASRNA